MEDFKIKFNIFFFFYHVNIKHTTFFRISYFSYAFNREFPIHQIVIGGFRSIIVIDTCNEHEYKHQGKSKK